MGANSKIEWTDHTFNPWRGCEHAVDAAGQVHPACQHCYAEAMSQRNPGTLGTWGSQAAGGVRVQAAESYWRQPLKWNAAAVLDGRRHRVFCASLADVFEDWQGPIVDSQGELIKHCHRCGKNGPDGIVCPHCGRSGPADNATMDDLRRELFKLIDATPYLDWLLLTKRPENIREHLERALILEQGGDPHDANFFAEHGEEEPHTDLASVLNEWIAGDPPKNVWLGTSVSNQHTADVWVPRLLKCRDLCPLLFLSIEPLLGAVQLTRLHNGPGETFNALTGEVTIHRDRERSHTFRASDVGKIGWCITGGESGPHARVMRPEWERRIRDDCQAAGVPYFKKQWGEWLHMSQFAPGSHDLRGVEVQGPPHDFFARVGKKKAGRLLDGVEHSEFPQQEGAAR